MKPKIKFKQTLCGTYFTSYRGIIVTAEKLDSGHWFARSLRRDNFRFVEDEALASFECRSKTRQAAAQFVCGGISCMANISINFAKFVREQELAAKARDRIEEIKREGL